TSSASLGSKRRGCYPASDSRIISQSRTRVKLNWVFFPR
ncbi:unnamed protein product, partial [Brassica oleracea]